MKTTSYIHKIRDIRGKTIESVEDILAEYGRTYRRYVCIVFTDETRVILIDGIPCNPHPSVEEMEKAPKFFSGKEIGEEIDRLRQKDRKNKNRRKESDRSTFLHLQSKYNW